MYSILNRNWFWKIGRKNWQLGVFPVHLYNRRYVEKMQGRLS
ncbi:hypothetical protein WAF17_13735 [Bernardetia sp. ABR2-2B]